MPFQDFTRRLQGPPQPLTLPEYDLPTQIEPMVDAHQAAVEKIFGKSQPNFAVDVPDNWNVEDQPQAQHGKPPKYQTLRDLMPKQQRKAKTISARKPGAKTGTMSGTVTARNPLTGSAFDPRPKANNEFDLSLGGPSEAEQMAERALVASGQNVGRDTSRKRSFLQKVQDQQAQDVRSQRLKLEGVDTGETKFDPASLERAGELLRMRKQVESENPLTRFGRRFLTTAAGGLKPDEEFINAPVNRAEDAVNSLMDAATRGIASMPEGFARIADNFLNQGDIAAASAMQKILANHPDMTPAEKTEAQARINKLHSGLSKMGDYIEPISKMGDEASKGLYPRDPNAEETINPLKADFWSHTMPQAAGSMLPFMAASGVGGALKIAPELVAGGAGMAMEVPEGYHEARAAGATPEQLARTVDIRMAAGGTEALGAESLFGNFGKKLEGNVFGYVTKEGAIEGIQEGGQKGIEDVGDKYYSKTKPELTAGQMTMNALQNAVPALFLGAGGGAMGIPAHLAERNHQKIAQQIKQVATTQPDHPVAQTIAAAGIDPTTVSKADDKAIEQLSIRLEAMAKMDSQIQQLQGQQTQVQQQILNAQQAQQMGRVPSTVEAQAVQQAPVVEQQLAEAEAQQAAIVQDLQQNVSPLFKNLAKAIGRTDAQPISDVADDPKANLLTEVRKAGGISAGEGTVEKGELDRLGIKEAGTTGIISRTGGESADRMRERMASEGLTEAETPQQFIGELEAATKKGKTEAESYADYQRSQMTEQEIADSDKLDEVLADKTHPFTQIYRTLDNPKTIFTKDLAKKFDAAAQQAGFSDDFIERSLVEFQNQRATNPNAKVVEKNLPDSEPGRSMKPAQPGTSVSMSPYKVLEANNKELLQKLHKTNLNSKEGVAGVNQLRDWARANGIEQRHVGAWISDIQNWQKKYGVPENPDAQSSATRAPLGTEVKAPQPARKEAAPASSSPSGFSQEQRKLLGTDHTNLLDSEFDEYMKQIENLQNMSVRGKEFGGFDINEAERKGLVSKLIEIRKERKARVKAKRLPALTAPHTKATAPKAELGEQLVEQAAGQTEKSKVNTWNVSQSQFIEESLGRLKESRAGGTLFTGKSLGGGMGNDTELAFRNKAKIAHRQHVEEAIARGEKVSPEVLADYPDLAKRETANVPQRAEIDEAAHEAATSPRNELPEPTEAQIEAGNYKKGHINLHGLDVTIENPKGSTRSGVGEGGKKWSVKMSAHYGYVKRTEGADGEQIDVYIGDKPESSKAFVVDQIDPKAGKFDEHKVILGAESQTEAEKLYDAHFDDKSGPSRRQNVTEMTVDRFKEWLKTEDNTKPVSEKPAELRPLPAKNSTKRIDGVLHSSVAAERVGGLDFELWENESTGSYLMRTVDESGDVVEGSSVEDRNERSAKQRFKDKIENARQALGEQSDGQVATAKPVVSGETAGSAAVAESGEAEGKRDASTAFPDTRSGRIAQQLADGKSLTNIQAVRKQFDTKIGTEAAKKLEEDIEFAGVLAARQIVGKGLSTKETYAALLDLHNRMPNLNTRTSESVRDQAYSTPLPIAYAASRLAGITQKTTVYEPTGGNGALVIEANPDNTTINDLNPQRVENLRAQGFEANKADATKVSLGAKVDVVIANPPFGVVKENGQSKQFETPFGKTAEIDHAIVFKALEAMADDGKAVLIVGGVNRMATTRQARSDAYNQSAKRKFYPNLYDNYNVVDHFTIDGQMYAKQGAAWPVDVIVIDGRGKSARQYPAVDVPEIVRSYEELGEKISEGKVLDSTERQQSVGSSEGTTARPGRLPGFDDSETSGSTKTGRKSRSSDGGRAKQPATSERPSGERTEPVVRRSAIQESAESATPKRTESQSETAKAGSGVSETTVRENKPAAVGERTDSGIGRTSELDQMFEEEFADMFGESPKEAQPKREKSPTQTTQTAKVRTETTAKPATKSSLKQSADALMDLFGDKPAKPGPPASRKAPGFDESLYQKAKPQFEAALSTFEGLDDRAAIRELLNYLKSNYGERAETAIYRMKPYIIQFVEDRATPTETETKPEAKVEPRQKQVISEQSESSHAAYEPLSTARSLNVAIPKNMSGAVKAALANFEERHGSPDKYVAEKLGYKPEEIEKYFSAEQVDALSLAVDNIEQGKGFVIGDQTGIGKGRINAGIIRYAIKNSKTPVFVTQKPALYADMIRDLKDIGMESIRPLITNSGESIPLNDVATEWMHAAVDAKAKGEKVPKLPSDAKIFRAKPDHVATLEQVGMSGKLKGYDVVFTTYDQMNPMGGLFNKERHAAVSSAVRGGVLIMDESHTAGGVAPAGRGGKPTPSRSKFFRGLVNAAGSVFYSSATYAKRPDVMDLYSKTDLGLLGKTGDALTELFGKGGVALQQVVASKLAEAGQYLRRERTFDGITYSPEVVEVNKQHAENVSTTMRMIVAFDNAKRKAVADLKENVKASAAIASEDGSIGSAGVDSSNFTSLMHNVIDQMLLGLKADQAAAQAIKAIQNGERPVLTVSNTMESFLKDAGLSPGDAVDLSFKDVLMRYLQRSCDIVIKDRDGNKVRRPLTDDELGDKGLAAFEAVQDFINESDFGDIPISPIDRVRELIEKAGYKVDEITGRGTRVDSTTGAVPILRARSAQDTKVAGRRRVIGDFNNGRIDALILNQAGSTGISLHASPAGGKDVKPRHMIIWQAEKNIDTHMQMLGRVNRTGQVTLPRYTQMIADVPAEKRPAAVLLKKMASLSANTTASRKSAVQTEGVTDFINELGDKVVARILTNDTELSNKLGDPLDYDGDELTDTGAARKVSGRIPLLTLAEQHEVYERIESEYADYLAQKEAMGENPLEARTEDFKAETISKEVLTEGVPGSPFSEPAYLEKVKINRTVKPYTSAEVAKMVRENLGLGDDANDGQVKNAAQEKLSQFVKEIAPLYTAYEKSLGEGVDETDTKSTAVAAGLMQKARTVGSHWHTVARVAIHGAMVTVNTDAGSVSGVVLDVSKRGKPKNPVALGSWVVRLAVLDGRELRLSFNEMINKDGVLKVGQSPEVNRLNPETGMFESRPMLPEFDASQGTKKQTRYMVTGNIVSGYAALPKGQILNYTDSEGNVKQGVLLPANFDAAKTMAEMPVELSTASQVIDFFDRVPRGSVSDAKQEITILPEKYGTDLEIRVLSAKSIGGKYYLDKDLTAITGNFVKQGGLMKVNIDRAKLPAVMSWLKEQGIGLNASHKAEAKEMLGQSRTAPPASRRSVIQAERRADGSQPMPERYTARDLAQNARATYRPSVNRPGVVVVNDWGGELLNKALFDVYDVKVSEGNFTISPAEVGELSQYIRSTAEGNYEPNQKTALNEFAKSLDQAIQDAKKNKQDVGIVTRQVGSSLDKIKTAIRHESVHLSQSKVASDLASLTDKNWLEGQAQAKQIGDYLAARGYAAESHAFEAAAFVASGDYARFEMSSAEANRFLNNYFKAVVEKHGIEALDKFGALHPSVQQSLQGAKNETQTGQSQRQIEAQGAGNAGERGNEREGSSRGFGERGEGLSGENAPASRREAGGPASKLANPMDVLLYQQSIVKDRGSRGARMYVNDHARAILGASLTEVFGNDYSNVNAINLSREEVKKVADYLATEAKGLDGDYRAGAEGFVADLRELLSKNKTQRTFNIVDVSAYEARHESGIRSDQERAAENLKGDIREEGFHWSQREINGQTVALVGVSWAQSSKGFGKYRRKLIELGYPDDAETLAAETAAKIAAGKFDDLGIRTEADHEQAQNWLANYFERVAEKHGIEALEKFDRLLPKAKEAKAKGARSVKERLRERIEHEQAQSGGTSRPRAPGGESQRVRGADEGRQKDGAEEVRRRSAEEPFESAEPVKGPQLTIDERTNAENVRRPGEEAPEFSSVKAGANIQPNLFGKAETAESWVDPLDPESVEQTTLFGKDGMPKKTWGDMWANLADVLNLPKALRASGDLSAAGRQGWFLSIPPSRWAIAARSFGKGVRSSEAMGLKKGAYKALKRELTQHPAYKDMIAAGWIPMTSDSGELTAQTELFGSRFAGKIPWAKYSEQAYKMNLDFLALSTFELYKKGIDKSSRDLRERHEGYKAAVDWINVSSGRGSYSGRFGKWYKEKPAPFLNVIGWAPGLVYSRMQLLNPVTYAKNLKNPQSRVVFRKQMSELFQSGAVLFLIGAMAKAGGALVSTDPDKADFLKIRFGTTRYDVLAGLQQVARLGIRMGEWARTRATEDGSDEASQKKLKKSANETTSALLRFGRTKLGPVPGFFIDWLNDWKKVTGERHAPGDFIGDFKEGETLRGIAEMTEDPIVSQVIPLFWADMVQAYEQGWRANGQEGALTHAAKMLPSGLGIGIQDYDRPEWSERTKLHLDAFDLDPRFPTRKTGEREGDYQKRVRSHMAEQEKAIEQFADDPNLIGQPLERKKTLLKQEMSDEGRARLKKIAPEDVADDRMVRAWIQIGVDRLKANPVYQQMSEMEQKHALQSYYGRMNRYKAQPANGQHEYLRPDTVDENVLQEKIKAAISSQQDN